MVRAVVVLALLGSAASAAAQQSRRDEDCRYEARRDDAVRASTRDLLHLIARAGSLKVTGREGASEVRISGRACASSRDLLDQLQLKTSRSGSTVNVEVPEIDQDGWRGNQYARLDLDIEVPAGMAAEIEDGSGATELTGLGALQVTDGSGELTISDVKGAVRVHDGSGELVIRGVDGNVSVADGSGEIQVQHVTGSVTIHDGSGSIEVTDVEGDVSVPEDGSGSIDVSDVRGDLTVSAKGSGSVHYARVGGRVDVPEREHRRRR